MLTTEWRELKLVVVNKGPARPRPFLQRIRTVQQAYFRKQKDKFLTTEDTLGTPCLETEDEALRIAAGELFQMRRRRDKCLPSFLCGEPGWDILLAAYSSPEEVFSSKHLTLAAAVTSTTGLRWLQVLERQGFLVKVANSPDTDGRMTQYRLTSSGRTKVGQALKAMLRD